MKRRIFLTLVFSVFLCFFITACGNTLANIDYEKVEDFEMALNDGEDLSGKTVTFTVKKLVPDSTFGYNLQAGEHLNFCSSKNPGVKQGDTITAKVTDVTSMLGSYIISYEIVK